MTPMVVVDFDGTLTEVDVGDAICDRFAPPVWREIDARWLRHEISLPEAQRQMWSLVRAGPDEIAAFADSVGRLRAGAEELFAQAASGRLELVLASGGFDLYIDRILGPWIANGALPARFANRLVWEAGRCVATFPHPDLACATCAICKGEVVRRRRSDGRTVAFVGDGASDACAAPVADRVFAVRGGLFEEHCRRRSIPHESFVDLGEVVAILRRA